MCTYYSDRTDAGKQLAAALRPAYGHRHDVIVLALPRGGVPVGLEVAHALDAPLDLLLVRKLGVPGREELTMGALSCYTLVLDRNLIDTLGLTREQVEFAIAHEQRELDRRERVYRDNQPPPSVRGKTVLLIDDGIATGATMKAAIEALRHREPAKIVVAVPLGPADACRELEHLADDVVCLCTPSPFYAISPHYQAFPQVTDPEVQKCMAETSRRDVVA